MKRYPSLCEINTRAWLRDLGVPSLDAVADAELDRLAANSFDWIWLLGVWQTGKAGRDYSLTLFPDADPADVCGSCFAITAYECHASLGGNPALARFRERLRSRGMRLMLDFVPNHTATDHPWTTEHRDYYMTGADHDGLAYGRDPNYPGWPDTLQLDYSNPTTQAAMESELAKIAGLCDGVRCDMAMLLLPDVFERTWGRAALPFWPRAIAAVRRRHPDFVFLAEAYWDLEWTMLQQGFDYAYDKRLYDRLRSGQAGPVRDHLGAPFDYQAKLARFLENHDEPRAAGVFPYEMHRAAALLTYCLPGLRFFYEGQLSGRRRQDPVHLCRRPPEPPDPAIAAFYRTLLPVLPPGPCRFCECRPAWEGNSSNAAFIICRWDDLLLAVNYSPQQSQCYASVSLPGPRHLIDLLSDVRYNRDGELLYLDLPPWGCHLFHIVE